MRQFLNAVLALGVLALGTAPFQLHAQTASTAAEPEADIRLYAVEIKTGPNWDHGKSPNEQTHFREHSANLKKLRDAGHILMGARYADKGLLVFSAKSAAAVDALMEQDPSMKAGSFMHEVHDFNVFYPGTVQARPRR